MSASLALLVAGAAAASVASAPPTSPARLQVSADEFTLALSRPSIRRGAAIVELVNYGEDDHDLALRRGVKGAPDLRIRTVPPGETGELERVLRPGRYRLWCTLADHRARGMRAVLVVRSS